MTEASRPSAWLAHEPVGDAGHAAPAPVPRLVFEGIGRRYGPVEAVRDVTLAVSPGEVLCLLGPSGCGKSTLLRIAAGIERQSEGRVLIDGEEVGGPTVFIPPEQRRVGLVFQDYALFPHLTVADNVRFGLKRGARGDSQAEEALAAVGLGHHAASYPHALSGGEQQRVALVRAIAPHPRVLLMDEPFSGLDSRLRERVRHDTLDIVRKRGVTAIMVTHDPAEAMAVGDRIALMRAGRLVQVASPAELYRRPVDLEAARFFSEVNEFQGLVRAEGIDLPTGRLGAGGLAEGAVATVAVRPQDLRVDKAPPASALATPSAHAGQGSGDVAGADGRGGRGTVTARIFLGEVDDLEILIEGMAHPIAFRDRTPGRLAVGDAVTVAIAEGAALVFAG